MARTHGTGGVRMPFAAHLFVDFFVALGMVLGGSICGGLAALLRHMPPLSTMVQLADQLKIWALVSTIGGTMDTLRAIENGVLGRQLLPVGRQFAFLVAAFLGCQAGYVLIRWLASVES